MASTFIMPSVWWARGRSCVRLIFSISNDQGCLFEVGVWQFCVVAALERSSSSTFSGSMGHFVKVGEA